MSQHNINKYDANILMLLSMIWWLFLFSCIITGATILIISNFTLLLSCLGLIFIPILCVLIEKYFYLKTAVNTYNAMLRSKCIKGNDKSQSELSVLKLLFTSSKRSFNKNFFYYVCNNILDEDSFFVKYKRGSYLIRSHKDSSYFSDEYLAFFFNYKKIFKFVVEEEAFLYLYTKYKKSCNCNRITVDIFETKEYMYKGMLSVLNRIKDRSVKDENDKKDDVIVNHLISKYTKLLDQILVVDQCEAALINLKEKNKPNVDDYYVNKLKIKVDEPEIVPMKEVLEPEVKISKISEKYL